ncbi:protein of unknown function [Methylocaldum szegediense]|uniref:Uncharacterized protein n=1 Tax=Methylocaldum szegediense TaxID=73780 RepID=A0ABM9I2F7_9GAMM|nr:protein of unknown function [Methylocaldum szegediense]
MVALTAAALGLRRERPEGLPDGFAEEQKYALLRRAFPLNVWITTGMDRIEERKHATAVTDYF